MYISDTFGCVQGILCLYPAERRYILYTGQEYRMVIDTFQWLYRHVRDEFSEVVALEGTCFCDVLL